jgi:RimJ/RimL family protein N-acetyltransferase
MFSLKNQTIKLRLACESDAGFILSLRLDERLNTHLSKVEDDLNKQKEWLKQYKLEEEIGKQYYFIVERNDGVFCGTVRIYDLKDDSFCWGSWILNEDKTRTAAIESAFQVYEFGFDKLGFVKSHFEVRKNNLSVNRFHQKMGAKKTGEDEDNVYYEITKESVCKFFDLYKGRLL